MNIRVAALASVFIAFSALSGVATFQHGYLGIFEAGFRDSASMQVFFDLVISISLFGIWMIVDARKRGAVVWPYLLAIPAVGSFAPLTYLLVRELGASPTQLHSTSDSARSGKSATSRPGVSPLSDGVTVPPRTLPRHRG